jgi:hypothetical protein
MSALASTPTPRTIRVYCPSHKVGFLVAASLTIECSSSTHTLARNFPTESFWEYCCDCQHYWPIDAAKANTASVECPVCERTIVRRFLCAECKVVSVESDDVGKRKAFLISSQGTIGPTCPGCLRRCIASGFEHHCQDFAGVFVTTREVCPFCDQRLEPPPSFPCSVAAYVEKLPRSALRVSFEPSTSLLRESSAPICFLIPFGRDSALSIVIPKATTLGSRQDYYNAYYELFNCENPAAGEVVILSPAMVEAVEGGWQVKEPGFIEIKSNPAAQSRADDRATVVCEACGSIVDAGHSFCKRCGARINTAAASGTDSYEGETDPEASVAAFDAAPAFAPETHPAYERPPVGTTNSAPHLKKILGVVGGIVVLGIILTIIATLSTSDSSLRRRLDSAIARGQLFTPATDNAHDLYNQLKNSGASEETLRPYREKLLPLLTDQTYQMIKEFMVPGSDELPIADWQSAYQSMQWAVELKPGDSQLLARSMYCEGRLAYLAKDENRAIDAWTRAAEADKNWPLPVNGIGLIHTARRNHRTARSYYLDAARRDPNWAYPYNNIGTSYYLEKNYYEAKGYYQKAAQLAPQWARPHSWLGDIAMKEADYPTAIQEFSLVLEASATGTKNMDLDKIRKQLDLARERSAF